MKKKKKKHPRNRNKSGERGVADENIFPPDGITWMEGDGVHALLPGEKPSKVEIHRITQAYQRQIRKSPLFKQWVKQFGKKKSVEILKECRFEVR